MNIVVLVVVRVRITVWLSLSACENGGWGLRWALIAATQTMAHHGGRRIETAGHPGQARSTRIPDRERLSHWVIRVEQQIDLTGCC